MPLLEEMLASTATAAVEADVPVRAFNVFFGLGNGEFEPAVAVPAGTRSYAMEAVDVNGDGWTDLYVLNMEGFDGYWENQAGERFVDKSVN